MAFEYYNSNPDGLHIPDCVIRAISFALGKDYYEVVRLLYLNGQELKCDCLNVRCYEKLLDYDFNLPHYISHGKSVEEVANDFADNILLIRIKGHLTTSINSIIKDIWDCSKEEVTDFWVVK